MKKKTGVKTEELWLIVTFLVMLAAFALIICGIYAAKLELCKIVWLILMAAMLSIPLRRRVFTGLGKNNDNRK